MNRPDGQPTVAPAKAPAIADHELFHPIAAGSYGEVWLARNAVGTLRAVKIVRHDRHASAESFDREFKGLQKFEPVSRAHGGLVDILTLGLLPDGAGFYYVMELADDVVAAGVSPAVEGGILPPGQRSDNPNISLFRTPVPPGGTSGSKAGADARRYSARTLRHDLKQHGHLPVADCIQLGLKLTAALAHLHAQGLVHRDVKPSNILFIGGEPKLADAGLVAAMDDARSLVGTAGYIAPEGPGAPQADLYALGKVLYEAAFGKDRQEFPALPADVASRPDHARLLELNAVLLKACATNPSERYQSAEEMHADMALLERGQSVKRKRMLQHWLSVSKKTGLTVSLLAVVVTAAVVLRQHPSDPYLHSAIPGVDKLVEQGNSVVQGRTAERIRAASGYYNEAIQLDPNFVPARFGVFMTLVYRGGAERGAPDEVRRDLRAIAKKLMEMDSNLAESRIASSMIKWVDWQFPEALAEAHLANQKRAASKEGEAMAHHLYGYLLLQTGKPDEALEQYRLAEEKSPSGAMMQHHLGHPYFVKRDFEQALKHYRESLRLAPGQGTAHYFIGRVYEEQTNFVAAIQEFRERTQLDGEYDNERTNFYDALREAVRQGGAEGYWRKRLDIALGKSEPDPYYIATLYARLGEKDKAYTWLKEACEKKAFDQGLMFDLCWDHDDEQFKAIARGIRLLQ